MLEEEEATPEERELGKTLSRMFGDRVQEGKDLYFKNNPETAAVRYPFDKRSIEVLGAKKWQELFGPEDD